MPSKRKVEPLDRFEIDVPITPADSEAQWKIRNARTMETPLYLEWCGWLTRDAVEPARDHHTEPFEL
jgi:hypothetical protein